MFVFALCQVSWELHSTMQYYPEIIINRTHNNTDRFCNILLCYLPITTSSPVDCDPVHAEHSRIVTGSWKTGSPHLQGRTASSVACSPLGLLFATYSFSYNAAMHTLPKYCIWADGLSLTPLWFLPQFYITCFRVQGSSGGLFQIFCFSYYLLGELLIWRVNRSF